SSDLEFDRDPRRLRPGGNGTLPEFSRHQVWSPRLLCRPLGPLMPPVNKPLFVVDRVFGRDRSWIRPRLGADIARGRRPSRRDVIGFFRAFGATESQISSAY